MKVRVIKEMPFTKVGDIWECQQNNYGAFVIEFIKDDVCPMLYMDKSIEPFIKEGWLEEVKEESEEATEISNSIRTLIKHGMSVMKDGKEVNLKEFYKEESLEEKLDDYPFPSTEALAQMIKDHYLGIFDDKATGREAGESSDTIKRIRQALEKA